MKSRLLITCLETIVSPSLKKWVIVLSNQLKRNQTMMQNLKMQLRQKTTSQTKSINPSKTQREAKPPVFIVPFSERQRSKGTIPVQKRNENIVQLQQVKVRKLNKPYWKKNYKRQMDIKYN